MRNQPQYEKFTSVWEINHSIRNSPQYEKSTTVWEIHLSMKNPPQYEKSTTVWEINHSMRHPPQYEKSTTVWEIHHSMRNQPQYEKSTTVWEIHRSMWNLECVKYTTVWVERKPHSIFLSCHKSLSLLMTFWLYGASNLFWCKIGTNFNYFVLLLNGTIHTSPPPCNW